MDDPYTWGAIAAANALSDVYAMGARPTFALNIVNFPRDTLPLTVLEQVIVGGAAKASEAGIAVLGGHSIDDPEPKFGLVALGLVHPLRILRNVGAQRGDALILTKPLGIGVITTAIKRGLASNETVAAAVSVMSTLNKQASEAMVAAGDGVHAATDVTGFGLLGHLSEMLGRGDVGVDVDADSVPVLAGVAELVQQDVVPGGTRRNMAAIAHLTDWSERLSAVQRIILCDAQTSGGLLIAVDDAKADTLLADLEARGVTRAARIGTFTDRLGRLAVV
ncbi:MAG: selenide, water dikinase SelD [Chloroflexota bacterium]